MDDQQVNTTAQTDQDSASLRLLLAATLVDHFDPMEFGQTLIDSKLRNNALAGLSYNCDEVQHEGAYHWSLKPDKRRDLLKQYFKRSEFDELLEKVEPSPGDSFAKYLHQGLKGHDLTKEANKASDAHALLRAVRLVEHVGVEPDSSEDSASSSDESSTASPISGSRYIRQSIARTAAMDELNNTTGGRLYGRAREFRELISYRNTDFSDQATGPLKLFVIIGVGGIGKSSLISRYIAWQRSRPARTLPQHSTHAAKLPVVHFDFDRPILIPEDPMSLTLEFTRQLGMLDSTIDVPLSRFRHKQRMEAQSLPSEDMLNRTTVNTLADLQKVLAKWPLRQAPVTLVIDTFEEVALRGRGAVETTLKWLKALRNVAQLENLHIIISGREMPDSLLSDHGVHICHRIRLTDLPAPAAALLLTSAGIDREVAAKAVAIFGGNPLVLRMFIRFCQNNPDEIQALLQDGLRQKRSAPTGRLALTFLFERILIRITDPRIKALTSPGLLLRHITADLIHKVLAQPCGLGELSEEEANTLFNTLASHVWLVRQEGDRLLSHRRDLRRLMLPGIRQHYPDIFDEINERAVAYYESAPPGVSESEAWLEAAYHRGFLPDVPVYSDPIEARQIITQLGADLLDWPVHATALIKHAAQLPQRLTEDELASLSQTHELTSRAIRTEQRRQGSSATAKQSQITGSEQVDATESAHPQTHQESGAAKVNEAQSSTSLDSQSKVVMGKREIEEQERLLRLAFHQGRFENISDQASDALQPLFRKRDALASTHYWQDETLLDSVPWLVGLSVLAEPDAELDAESIIPVNALDAVQATPRRVGIYTTFELFYMLAIASLMNDQRAVDSLSSFLRSSLPCFSPPIRHAAQLQILQLSVRAITSGELIGQRDIVTVENCEFLRFESLSLPMSEEHPETRHNRQRMALVNQTQEAFMARRPSLDELADYAQHLQQHKIDVLGPAGLDRLASRQHVLYPCIRFVLETVPPAVIHAALAELSERSCYWPEELTPEPNQPAPTRGYGQTVLTNIIQLADRCGLLSTLMERVSLQIADPLLHEELRLLQRLDTRLTGTSGEIVTARRQ